MALGPKAHANTENHNDIKEHKNAKIVNIENVIFLNFMQYNELSSVAREAARPQGA